MRKHFGKWTLATITYAHLGVFVDASTLMFITSSNLHELWRSNYSLFNSVSGFQRLTYCRFKKSVGKRGPVFLYWRASIYTRDVPGRLHLLVYLSDGDPVPHNIEAMRGAWSVWLLMRQDPFVTATVRTYHIAFSTKCFYFVTIMRSYGLIYFNDIMGSAAQRRE